ncbi:MAG: hypothetical protein RL307_1052 [Pseudomonadota bacterium]|jgi:uncharacterized membrane protein YedE/YeeE
MQTYEPRPFWHPLFAGIVLGLVLFLTFLLTGHGLGATGFTTRLVVWLGLGVAPDATMGNEYLGGMAESGNPLSSWITWQVIGVVIGAFLSARLAGRFRIQIDGQRTVGTPKRLFWAAVGGLIAGFGARVSAGCTSGLGLSGAATLSLAGFVFLGTFFVAGLIATRLIKGVK